MSAGNARHSHKKFSTVKAMLAAMWQLKETSRGSLVSHKYLKLLCPDKHKNTRRSGIFRLCKLDLIRKEYNDVLVLTEKGQKKSPPCFY